MPKRVLMISAAAVLLAIGGTIVWKQAFATYVTSDQVKALLKEHLHIGSTKPEVEAFIESLRFDRVTTTNLGYRPNEKRFEDERGMFDEKNRKWKDTAKGYLSARLEGVGLTYFQPRCIDIRFYFDKDDRLLDLDMEEYFIGT